MAYATVRRGPWILTIIVEALPEHYRIIIEDNGVGRKKGGEISAAKKHGTGTKNLADMLEIISEAGGPRFLIAYEDVLLPGQGTVAGTRCIITISKSNTPYESASVA